MEPDLVLHLPEVHLSLWRPELALVVTLLLGLVASVRPRPWLRPLMAGGLAVALWLALDAWSPAAWTLVEASPLQAVRPLGPHFAVDAVAGLVRVVVLATSLLTVLNLRTGDPRAAVLVPVSALGIIGLSQAATTGGLLLAVAVTILGGSLAAWTATAAMSRPTVRHWHLTATLGFMLLAAGVVLWSGLAGSLELAASLDQLALRPYLPPLALPSILALLAVGLVLALLGEPSRFGAAVPPALACWLTTMPPLGLIALLLRLLQQPPAAPPLAAIPQVLTVAAGILIVGGFLAAMVQADLARRLSWAAAGQAGLALVGFSTLSIAGGSAALLHLLVLVPAQFGALLVAALVADLPAAQRRRHLLMFLLAALLLGLAALPPVAAWRPRFVLLQTLLAGDHLVGAGLVLLGTLLGCVVYLWPLVTLWLAEPGDQVPADAAPIAWSQAALPVLTAAAMLGLLLVGGVGLLPVSS